MKPLWFRTSYFFFAPINYINLINPLMPFPWSTGQLTHNTLHFN